MMSSASTRPIASRNVTVSHSLTGATRSTIRRSASATGSSGPLKAKQSSLSCAITPSLSRWSDLLERQRFGLEHIGDAVKIIEHQHRHLRLRQRRVGRDGDDAIVIGMQQRLADRGAKNFEFWMRMALETFDDHQIDRAELRQNVGERRLGLVAKLVHDGPAPAGNDRDFAGAGLPVQPGILARLVGVEVMMRVFDGGDFQAAFDQHRDHAGDQCRLAGAAPARETDDAHRPYVASFARRFHAERADALARCFVPQYVQESLHGRPLAARFAEQKIVLLGRDGQKGKPVHPRHRLDGDAPIGAVLRDRCGDRVMRARLVGVAGRPRAAEQAVDQDARAGSGIAVDHQHRGIGERGFQRRVGGAAFEPRVA